MDKHNAELQWINPDTKDAVGDSVPGAVFPYTMPKNVV